MLRELTHALPSRTLTGEEIGLAAQALLDPTVGDDPKAAFLSAWAQRGETAAELAACAEAFLPRAQSPGISGSWNGRALLDCCGTGGGGLDLFNVSTGMMFILGAIGIPVVKHGNRGMTKKSGSADVLEALGIKIDLPPGDVVRCLEEVGCAFLFAPFYHPAFAAVAPVRRQLGAQGQRTIFNLLGPLLNPARPDARLVGVFKREHVELYRETLKAMHCPRFTVAFGKDRLGAPLGEVSPIGRTEIGTTLNDFLDNLPPNDPKRIRGPINILHYDYYSRPDERKQNRIENFLVSTPQESAALLLKILSGEEKGLGRQFLVVNATVAAWTQGAAPDSLEAGRLVAEALDSGRALEQLKRWQKFSARYA